MASLDWSQCPAVESIPGMVSGAWVFKGTRLPVVATQRSRFPSSRNPDGPEQGSQTDEQCRDSWRCSK